MSCSISCCILDSKTNQNSKKKKIMTLPKIICKDIMNKREITEKKGNYENTDV